MRTESFLAVPSLELPQGFIKGSVGAGDAYAAGCLYGLYNNYDDRRILNCLMHSRVLSVRIRFNQRNEAEGGGGKASGALSQTAAGNIERR